MIAATTTATGIVIATVAACFGFFAVITVLYSTPVATALCVTVRHFVHLSVGSRPVAIIVMRSMAGGVALRSVILAKSIRGRVSLVLGVVTVQRRLPWLVPIPRLLLVMMMMIVVFVLLSSTRTGLVPGLRPFSASATFVAALVVVVVVWSIVVPGLV